MNQYSISTECKEELKKYTTNLSSNYIESGKTSNIPQELIKKYNLSGNAYEIGAILHAIQQNSTYANLNP